jgi:hypothetical protein
VTTLDERVRRAGLRLICETPFQRGRLDEAGGRPFDLAREMATTGLPFLQVLVQRDDAAPSARTRPDTAALRDLHLWADLTPAAGPPGSFRTTTGAIVRPSGEDGLARAVAFAPGFVAVSDLAPADGLATFETQLFEAWCEGVLVLRTVPPLLAPSVPLLLRERARAACAAGVESEVLTNALHASFWISWAELAVLQLLDGERTPSVVAANVLQAAQGVTASLAGPLANATLDGAQAFVDAAIDRFRRHLFLAAS